nr:uncharacterized protein LOC131787903 isoform X2 [Pocillopora verrucosa]
MYEPLEKLQSWMKALKLSSVKDNRSSFSSLLCSLLMRSTGSMKKDQLLATLIANTLIAADPFLNRRLRVNRCVSLAKQL